MIATLPDPPSSDDQTEAISELEDIFELAREENKPELSNIAAIQTRANDPAENPSETGDINELFDSLIKKIKQSRRKPGG